MFLFVEFGRCFLGGPKLPKLPKCGTKTPVFLIKGLSLVVAS